MAIDGTAEIVTDPALVGRTIDLVNRRSSTNDTVDFLNLRCMRPCAYVRGGPLLVQDDFNRWPTRWRFGTDGQGSRVRPGKEWRPGRLTADQADEGATDTVTWIAR